MKLYEKTLSSESIYDGKIIHVRLDQVELENGKTAMREVVDHPGGVSVAALTPENQLIFVRQFRYPYKKVLLELPAGKLEPGEDPFEAMKREQMEETGTTGENYISLGEVYPTGGYCGEIIRLWACRVRGDQHSLHLDEDEFLSTERIPLEKAVEMVYNLEIPDAKTQIGILKTAHLVEKGLL
ncbi:NUDIX hydrolase [Acutalibacter intestini]|uniref:NUDIX hydrolase n=1 Tax=Acutalibacter intestini TaxID=3093659 RepID=UPI002AC9E303|nr:NUDIX hydrolase [Acutalibacter sp. M00204]